MIPVELIVFGVVAVVMFFQAIKKAKSDERLVIFRLGQIVSVRGPGTTFVIPFIDKAIKVNLPRNLPEWQSLSKEQLEEQLTHLVVNEPNLK